MLVRDPDATAPHANTIAAQFPRGDQGINRGSRHLELFGRLGDLHDHLLEIPPLGVVLPPQRITPAPHDLRPYRPASLRRASLRWNWPLITDLDRRGIPWLFRCLTR